MSNKLILYDKKDLTDILTYIEKCADIIKDIIKDVPMASSCRTHDIDYMEFRALLNTIAQKRHTYKPPFDDEDIRTFVQDSSSAENKIKPAWILTWQERLWLCVFGTEEFKSFQFRKKVS